MAFFKLVNMKVVFLQSVIQAYSGFSDFSQRESKLLGQTFKRSLDVV